MKQFSSLCLSITTAFALSNGAVNADPLIDLAAKNPAVNTSGLTVSPSNFEENKGQVLTTTGDAAPFVRYRLTQGNASIFLLGNGIAYQFNRMHYPDGYAALEKDTHLDLDKQQELDAMSKEIRLETYRMDMLLEGANADASITTEGRSDDYTQYYNHHALDVHTYSRVTYHEVYPGIDWVVYTTAKGIEYDFVLQPGADPAKIELRFKDHEELYLDADGQLIHGNRMGRFTEERPVSFQNGKEVDTRFVLEGDRLTFVLDAYDRSQPITIDPARIWGTYYGGSNVDWASSCAVDNTGNVYLAGDTRSDAAIAFGGHQMTHGGSTDAFLVKFNGNGVRLWSTYYGGNLGETGASCAVDGDGNVYLAGTTGSAVDIAQGGHQELLFANAGAYLVKFNTVGVRQWATYYAGYDNTTGYSCAVDGGGDVYLAGSTSSGTGIAMNGYQDTLTGSSNSYLAKFNTNGVRLWATYYGGTFAAYGYCAVDGSGNVYLAGQTSSSSGIAYGGHQNIFGGGASDPFLVKFNMAGARQWATYYGGAGSQTVLACAADINGNVYLAGLTDADSVIAMEGHQMNYGGGDVDAFLVKFDASGIRQWGTYYGGSQEDGGYSCAADSDGNVYLAGSAESAGGIFDGGFDQNSTGGEAFLVKFDVDGVRQWGSYYGGGQTDRGGSCAVGGNGNVYLAGSTASSTDIAFEGYQNSYAGSNDAFLVKIDGGGISTAITSPQDHRQSFTIWPNPNTGERFYLQAQESGLAKVQIFDALGKLQRTEQLHLIPGQAPVEVTLGSELAKGLYMVRITVEGSSSVAPLVIE